MFPGFSTWARWMNKSADPGPWIWLQITPDALTCDTQ